MGDVETGTQKSGLTSPEMRAAAGTIGSQLNTQLQAGVKPYDQSMVPGLSGQTTAGINALSNNPLNASYTGAIGNTMGEFGAIASGQRMGEGDAAWNAAKDNVIADTNSAFNASGRFGGGSNVSAVSEGLGKVELSRLMGNEARQMQAAGMLPGLYGASTMPASAQLQGGQIMDQWSAAKAQDDARRFDATQNAGWNTLQRGSSIFAGTAPVSGTTTTESQPWWKVGTGLGATALGFM